MHRFMRFGRPNHKPRQQPTQALFVHLNDRVNLVNRPLELLFLKPFVPQNKARSIPMQYLEFIATSIAKYVQTIVKGVHLKLILNQFTQAVDGLTKVDWRAVQVDRRQIVEPVHRPK